MEFREKEISSVRRRISPPHKLMYRHVTRAYTGEWSNGHLRRALILSGRNVKEEHRTGVRALLGNDVSGPAVGALAVAAGYKVEDYVVDHSLIPFSRAIVSRYLGVPHGRPAPSSKVSAFSYLRPDVFACKKCDVVAGKSYVRRWSQVPGIYWCEACSDPLFKLDAAKVAARPPSEWIALSTATGMSDQARDIPIVARYMALARLFMSRKEPLSVRDVSRVLASRMRALGFRVSLRSSSPTISSYLKEKVPKLWLESIFPGVSNDGLCPAIDCVGLSAYTCSAAAYLLSSAMLFECPERALAQLTATEGTFDEAKLRTNSLDEIVDLYVSSGGRNRGPVTFSDVEKREISKIFTLCGLPGIRNLSRQEWLALRGFYSGMRLEDSVALHGAEAERVETMVRRAGGAFARALDKLEPRANSRKRKAAG